MELWGVLAMSLTSERRRCDEGFGLGYGGEFADTASKQDLPLIYGAQDVVYIFLSILTSNILSMKSN